MQNVEVIREELVDIQQTVIDMGGLIEKVKGEGTESVRSFEKFCDVIYEIYQGNNADIKAEFDKVKRIIERDIIAKKDNYIVFVEVKYRSNNKYGYAVEAVNYRKKQIIRHVAQFYMATRYKSCDIPCRFDVIGIDGETVTHIKNAF